MIKSIIFIDSNEFVDRLRLFEALHQAGHNGYDNEILSIIEELDKLREAGLIINWMGICSNFSRGRNIDQ